MRIDHPFWIGSDQLKRLCDALDGRVRFVGGCVRDVLAGLPVHDIDMAVPFSPEEVKERLKPYFPVIPTGVKYGTQTVLLDCCGFEKVEVTTLRKDLETDGRHAIVAFTDDWKEDAARRDLTINALYADFDGTVFDYFNGIEDLKNGVVRFIGNAEDRIREDYLRILRYFRFYARFGKCPPDEEALDACRKGMEGLAKLSTERLKKEFFGILELKDAAKALYPAQKAGLFDFLFPVAPDVRTFEEFTRLAPCAPLIFRLFSLLPADKRVLSDFCRRWKLSKQDENRLLSLMQKPIAFCRAGFSENDAFRFRDCYGDDAKTAGSLFAAKERNPAWQRLGERAAAISVKPFDFSGGFLTAKGVDGKRTGEILRALKEYWLLKNGRTTRRELRELAESMIIRKE